MNPTKQFANRVLCLFVIGVLFNSSFISTQPIFAANRSESNLIKEQGVDLDSAINSEESAVYGIGLDGHPFALRKDGTKAKYLSVSPKEFRIQVFKKGLLGEATFIRKAENQFEATFTSSGSDVFSVRTTAASNKLLPKNPIANVTISLGNRRVTIANVNSDNSERISPMIEKELQQISSDLRANKSMSQLLATVRFFGSKPILAKVPKLITTMSESCGWAAASCIASLIEYGLGMALIAEVCAGTFGAGCILALLYHPVAGLMVANHCSAAITACGGAQDVQWDQGE